MKKTVLFSVMCIFIMLSANKTMAQVVDSGTTGDCTWELTGTSGNYTLTISGNGAMGNYYSNAPWYSYRTDIKTLDMQQGVSIIGSYAFASCIGLTSVSIPNSVTTIKSGAFYDCNGLTSVSIPNAVTTIEEAAFYSCIGLTSISVDVNNTAYCSNSGVLFNKNQTTLVCFPIGKTGSYIIPNSVTTIENWAFYFCRGLTSVSIPNSVTIIGDYAFASCIGLTSVSIPNSVTTIGNYAFYFCNGLTSVIIGDSVDIIGSYAFAACIGLTSVTIGNSVTTIGNNAFSGCTGLTSVSIPNSVTTIGNWVFSDCSGLTSISVDVNNTVYSSVTGILFNKDQTILICYPAGKTGSYTIPNSVTTIGNNAFASCIGLTSITIPVSVKNIEIQSFTGCVGLTSVSIPHSVITIGGGAFYNCTGLTEMYVRTVNPPKIFNSTFYNVDKSIPVYVCASAEDYRNATYWSEFANIIDDVPSFDITIQSNDATMGSANITQRNTCTDNTAIIEATPNTGYHFVQWNDGNTTNPRAITVTQDTTFTAEFAEGVGITNIKTSNIKIYPNPAIDNIHITLPENVAQAVFTVCDMQGKVLIRKEISGQDVVSVNNLAAGIYIYNVITNKQKHTGKLKINK
jgi:hypothetical protein